MNTETLSQTSRRYNWWTPEVQKSDISPLTQLSTIMQYGDAREVFTVFQMMDEASLRMAYGQISEDRWGVRERRHGYLRSLLESKAHHTI